MKILVTGANGFVGAALCRYFSNQGHEVMATGRQPNAPAELLNYATYFAADITQPLAPFDADAVIHVAALASDTATYQQLFLNNVTGTRQVLAAAKNCRYFVFISSSSVYQFHHKPVIEADADLNSTLSNYGKTKLLAEDLVKAGIPGHQQRLILRPRAIYGIGDRILLPRLLSLVRGNIVICPFGNTVVTSATHVDNLAYAIQLYLNKTNNVPLQLFNVADKQVYQLKSIALKILNAVTNRNVTAWAIPSGLLKLLTFASRRVHFLTLFSPIAVKAFTEDSVLNISQIERALSYRPPYYFDQAHPAIGDWIKQIGGVKKYLDNINRAPWMLPHQLINNH